MTTFQGGGQKGPVVVLFIVCGRRNLRELLKMVHKFEPDVLYTTEHVAVASRVYSPIFQPITGWRAILRKK